MKISFISYEYQPIKTPQSLRWQKLLLNLAALRPVSIRVFNAPALIDSPFYDKNFSSDFEVEVFSPPPTPVEAERTPTSPIPSSPRRKKPVNKLLNWFKTEVKKRLPFDKSFLWAFKARVSFLSFLEHNKPDIIISSSPPFGAMILAWFAKKHYKEEVKWICDLGDPWSFASDRKLGPLMKIFIEWLERHILTSADHIIVTNERTKSIYAQVLRIDKSRFSVIYQGADDNRNYIPYSTEFSPGYVYTGTFYKDIREPFFLFDSFSKNGEKLSIAGNIDSIFLPKDKNDKLSFIGNLSEKDVKALQCSATALIFIDNLNSAQLPGKLFEYIATGRPIICIGVSKSSPVNEIEFLDYPIVFCKNDTQDISFAVQKIREIGLHDYAGTLKVSWKNRASELGRIIDELY